MPDAFRRLRGATAPPSGADVLADLVEFHTARPGITEATLGACTLSDGRTGYDLLASHVPEGARAVLDLGAGNGPLAARLLARTPRLEQVAAVDACASDLALARQRAGADDRLLVLTEPAQALSLPDASMDAVLSHHAFYLMRPIEPVVRQIARVLRAGGLFAFVTWSSRATTLSPFTELMRVRRAHCARHPAFPGLGRPSGVLAGRARGALDRVRLLPGSAVMGRARSPDGRTD